MSRFNPFQPNENALPPEQVRFVDVHVEPWPDGRRVRVHLTLTPFQQPPDLEVAILDGQGREVSHIAIIENIDDHFVVTMHLRDPETQSDYRLEARLSYQSKGTIAQTGCTFQIPPETIP
ncbi:hypothetical protein LARV_02163 [Longilinea arvoryzae]|uniref:Uncharacterized protein n=1 Tax=Longilinea arvoryzae TaxID=360412 RepID=A0A0S7BL34_9CHLR|nr:hypothetical protein [Longilinea arvoryzae]GAP14394.1 hypothetical protein LARV_02163 [Longilinea arvoryzae]